MITSQFSSIGSLYSAKLHQNNSHDSIVSYKSSNSSPNTPRRNSPSADDLKTGSDDNQSSGFKNYTYKSNASPIIEDEYVDAFDFSVNAPSRRSILGGSTLSLNSNRLSSIQSTSSTVRTIKYGHKKSFSLRDYHSIDDGPGATNQSEISYLSEQGFSVESSPARTSGSGSEYASSGSRPSSTTTADSNTSNIGVNGTKFSRLSSSEISLRSTRSSRTYSFLRALHSFDASTLSVDASEEDPAAICLSFHESEIALLHSIHASGWGDATLMSTGARGWIPTNYFSAYTDPRATTLLTNTLSFVLNPKVREVNSDSSSPALTFSQSSITSIISGVRLLLQACGTLTRDTPAVKRSQSIRKFRKILLAEVAILVSLAKQYKNSTDDTIIERLVQVSYKIVARAIVFLDVWTLDTSSFAGDDSKSYDEPDSFPVGMSLSNIASLPSSVTLSSGVTMNNMSRVSVSSTSINTYKPSSSYSNNNVKSKRQSVIFHSSPPVARQRLDEVNTALNSYLGNFIHRVSILDWDSTTSTKILVNTRKSMLACRELLSVVESISSNSLPRSKEIENCKDKLFAQIRDLVAAAREVVAKSRRDIDDDNEFPSSYVLSAYTLSFDRLKDIALECIDTAGECVIRCRHILDRIGDFQLPASREYPDFSDSMISSTQNGRLSVVTSYSVNNSNTSPTSEVFGEGNDRSSSFYRRGSELESATDEGAPSSPITPITPNTPDAMGRRGSRSSLLPNIPILSPLMPTHSDSNGGDFSETKLSPRIAVVMEEEDEYSNNNKSVQIEDTKSQQEQITIVDLINQSNTNSFGTANGEHLIIDSDGRVRGGSLDGLVNYLTDPMLDQPPFYLSTFFLSFRQFCSPLELAQSLIRRFGEDSNDSESMEARLSRQMKVYNALKRWLESHWDNSCDNESLDLILEFANTQLPHISPNAKTIINDLAEKVESLPSSEHVVQRLIELPGGNKSRFVMATHNQTPMILPVISRSLVNSLSKFNALSVRKSSVSESSDLKEADCQSIISVAGSTMASITPSLAGSTWSSSLRIGSVFSSNGTETMSVLEFDPLDLAMQLTLMDYSIFSSIRPEELVELNFSMKRRHLGLAPNIGEMMFFANQLASFVGDSILGADVPFKTRKNLLKQWIKVADRCQELKNFNCMISIISALQSVNILRLKRVWEMLSPRYRAVFNNLKGVFSPAKNFASYRSRLKSQSPPCIPYLGLYLTDLTFVSEGNSTTRNLTIEGEMGEDINMKVINFDRYERSTKIIGELQQFQVPYRLGPVKELQIWLKNEMKRSHAIVSGDQNGLWRRSCIVEPK